MSAVRSSVLIACTLRLGLLSLLFALNACVDAFPTIGPAIRGPTDARPVPDADPTDADPTDVGPEVDRGMPPPDAAPSIDQGAPDMPPDAFVDPNACDIAAPVSATLRTWRGMGATRLLELETDCADITIDSPPWVTVTQEGQRLRLQSPAARGVSDGVIALTAEGRTVNIGVRRIGLDAGGPNRRALIYVVDGLKGETIAQSAPEAIAWLSQFATASFDAVPHMPPDDATRSTGWGSLLTGLPPARHGFVGQGTIDVPTFADRLEDKVFAAAEWPVIAAGLGIDPLPRRDAISEAVRAMASDAKLIVVGVDGLLGVAPDQIQARRAQIDADLDALLVGVARRPEDESWLIILTTAASDGEGPPDLPMLHAAPELEPNAVNKVTLQDVHTSVLNWLDVMRPGWDLPGAQLTGGFEGRADGECFDGADNDGDGRIDCRDADCRDACNLDCIDIELSNQTGGRLVDVTLTDYSDDLSSCANGGMAANQQSPDVTARWIAPRTGQYIISTLDSVADSDWDPVLETRVNECAPRVDPICRDDAFDDGSPAVLKLDAFEGRAYLFSISEFRRPDDMPDARLSIVETRAACARAPEINGIGDLRLNNNDREMSLPLLTDPPDTDDPLSRECRRTVAQRMIRWHAQPGDWVIDVEADFPHSLSLWAGACDDLSFRDCTALDGAVTINEARDYLIVVSSVWTDPNYETGILSVEVRADD